MAYYVGPGVGVEPTAMEEYLNKRAGALEIIADAEARGDFAHASWWRRWLDGQRCPVCQAVGGHDTDRHAERGICPQCGGDVEIVSRTVAVGGWGEPVAQERHEAALCLACGWRDDEEVL